MLLTARSRVSLAAIRGLVRPSAERVSRLAFRVYPFDIDLNGHLTNSRYPQIMDAGRMHLLMQGGELPTLLRQRLRPLLVHVAIDFHRELPLGARFVLETRVVGTERRALIVEQRFERDDVLHALGRVHLVLAGPNGLIRPEALAERYVHGSALRSSQ